VAVLAGDRTYAADINILGVVARAVRTSAKTPITTESGYLRLDDIPVVAGFAYKIYTSNLTLDSSADGEIGAARIRVVQSASPGTAATTSSTQIGLRRSYQDANANADLGPLITDYFAASDGYLSVILTAQRVTALGTFQCFASATEPCHLIVQCIGTDPGDTGVSL
jgi:hypothetical protein